MIEELGVSTYLRYSNPVFLRVISNGFMTIVHTLWDLRPIIIVCLNEKIQTSVIVFLLLSLVLFDKEHYVHPLRTKWCAQSSGLFNGTMRTAGDAVKRALLRHRETLSVFGAPTP